jgi:ubiquinone/menaquinone biosynthesis C-methylase UbiE
MINLAEKYNFHGNRCKYFLNDKNNLTLFKDKSFDLIYTNIVLQHMKPKYAKKYIKEFLRILSEQGILIFQIPSERVRSKKNIRKVLRSIFSTVLIDQLFYLRVYLKYIFNKEPRMDMYSIDKKEMVSFVEENGGKVVDIVKDQINHGNWESYIYYVLKI